MKELDLSTISWALIFKNASARYPDIDPLDLFLVSRMPRRSLEHRTFGSGGRMLETVYESSQPLMFTRISLMDMWV